MIAKVKRVGEGGAEIELPAEATRRTSLKEGDELTVFAPGGEVLLLARQGAARQGCFVGSLSLLSVAEVFGFVCTAIRSGTLILEAPDSRRTVVFREGQVAWATSTDRTERLGPILWRFGLLTLEQLETFEPQVKQGVKLGQLLIDAGILTAADLYRGMQLQVREIVVGVFSQEVGDFAFVDGAPAEYSTVKLPERTRDLVLSGMARAEEILLLRTRLPRGEQPLRIPSFKAPELPHQAAILGKVDGESNVAEVTRASLLGEYAGLKALKALVESGHVRVSSSAPVKPPPRPVTPRAIAVEGLSPLQVYKKAIQHICQQLTAAGAEAGRLNSFFQSLPEGLDEVFAGVTLTSRGDLDVETVLVNAQRIHKGAMGRAIAQESLDAFISFALFDAKNLLPTESAEKLAADVAKALRGEVSRMGTTGRDALAVALDVAPELALVLGGKLAAEVGTLKVGLSLFCAEGPECVRALQRCGARIFLDLKLHDIPATVEKAASAVGALGVQLLTIHASGGPAMVAAAVKGAGDGARAAGVAPPRILAVTVLTSLDAAELALIGFPGTPLETATRLAKLAVDAGAGGIVCSPQEAAAVRGAVGAGPLIVTPGIRPAGAALDDQSRVETPHKAIAAGADILVIGRPILQADDPIRAAQEIVAEIDAALATR